MLCNHKAQFTKMSYTPSVTMPSLSLFIFSFITFVARASVPPNATFKYVNEGEFGPYIIEYDGNYRPLPVAKSPFQLFFYNTTPNAFTLAMRMTTRRSESLRRFVWEANRGNPVRENATLAFGTDGNLVLADADGRVAWQTNTANKGVVGLELLPNGNLVLYDSRRKFLWQSFDYPTDTLLVGQSLRVGGVTKLVSRASARDNKDGPYSLVMEPKQLALYYKSKNSPMPVPYFVYPQSHWAYTEVGNLEYVRVFSSPENEEEVYAYELGFDYKVSNSPSNWVGRNELARPKYNSTLSFLRLGIDGNLRFYTFYAALDYRAWEVTYTLFDRESDDESECQLPERCGELGLCEDNQCVACPLSKGLVGWSKDCKPEKLTSCRATDFHYYKVDGVDHFMSKYTTGESTTQNDCGKKCSANCKCLGYFYHKETSKCWTAYDLKTLTKFPNATHVGYIKAPNH